MSEPASSRVDTALYDAAADAALLATATDQPPAKATVLALVAGYREQHERADRLAAECATLRSTRPPTTPPEPLGLGAVVEDAHGLLWVRIDDPPTIWAAARSEGERCGSYASIDAVRVVSEGVAT